MKLGLLEMMKEEIRNRMETCEALGKSYCLPALCGNVMYLHFKDIGDEWDTYMRELTSFFGKLGAKASAKSKARRKKKWDRQIKEAEKLDYSELARLGIYYDETTGCTFGFGDFDEAI
jgi:hypothetical protein